MAGVCSPQPPPTAYVVVDDSIRYQSLTGFGATLAYVEAEILRHPRRQELFEAMFPNLGLDLLRLQNRYGKTADDSSGETSEIVALASAKLGRKPTVFLTSWSPPAALKANGSLTCQGNVDTCTLVKSPEGSFDYAGYASYWRTSLDTYARAGLVPDYIGLQNNPDYVPTSAEPGEGCKFLAVEGTQTVFIAGKSTVVGFPGLAQATSAVVGAMAGLPSPPKLVAPEVSGVSMVSGYLAALEPSRVDAIAHHFYGMKPSAVDTTALNELAGLARNWGKPIFQTEMSADGLGTAVLMHYALVVEGASAYLQSVLVRPTSITPVNLGTLIGLSSDAFSLEDPYHAMRHYAFHTDPGWVRLEARADVGELLVSAWQSPNNESLTVILVNSGSIELAAQLDLGQWVVQSSQVARTVFDGVERSADLGALSERRILRVPGRSMVTVALQK